MCDSSAVTAPRYHPIGGRGNRSSKVCQPRERGKEARAGLPALVRGRRRKRRGSRGGKPDAAKHRRFKVSPSLIPPAWSCAESASKENQPLQMSAGEDLGLKLWGRTETASFVFKLELE